MEAEQCEFCGLAMPPQAKKTVIARRFCSRKCKNAAWRAKEAAESPRPAPGKVYELPSALKIAPAPPSETSEPASLGDLLENERVASEAGIQMLDRCIAAVQSMLEVGSYDRDTASHLAWMLSSRTSSLERLRKFGERVKTQTTQLSPEQRLRALAKLIQSMGVQERRHLRDLIDQAIDDINLLR